MGGGLCGCIPPPPEGGSVLHRKKDYEETKLNKNINVNHSVKYEKNKKVNNCKMF